MKKKKKKILCNWKNNIITLSTCSLKHTDTEYERRSLLQSLSKSIVTTRHGQSGSAWYHAVILIKSSTLTLHNASIFLHKVKGILQPQETALTLCRAQRPKTSSPVAIGNTHCFQTRKFPYNLVRISWIITVPDFHYFLPRHLHCLCVRSESERVFKAELKKRVAGFQNGSLRQFKQR